MSSSDKDEVDVGIRRISSQVGADGSAEVTLAAGAPMARTKSTPLGGGMGYSMRRVLSRDDGGRHAAAVSSSKQEVEGLKPSNNTSPLPLVKTKSGLSPEDISYSVSRVFSKEGGAWQSAIEVEGLVSYEESVVSRVSSRVDASDECAEAILLPNQIDDRSLQGSGYGLRQVKSTPLRGMEDGYSLKRTKTSGHDGSSLHKPLSLVRSRFSSIGKKGTKRKGTKDDGSTIAESDSSSSGSDYGQSERKKKRKFISNETITSFIVLFLMGVAGGGVYLLKPEVFGAGGDNDSLGESYLEAIYGSYTVPSSQPSNPLEAIPNSSSVPSSQPSNPLTMLVPIQLNATSQPTQGVTAVKPLLDDTVAAPPLTTQAPSQLVSSPTQNMTTVNATAATQNLTIVNATTNLPLEEDTIDAPLPTTQAPSQLVASSPAQNVTIVNATTDTQNVTSVNATTDATADTQNTTMGKPTNDTQTAPPTENTTLPLTSQNLTSSLANLTSSPTLSPDVTITEELVEEIPEDTITTFYVMADAPYSDEERYHLMPRHIDQLGDDGEFLVHLGDLQYAVVDRCREGAYYEAKEILKKSRMPTFVLPGDNDINDCDSMSHGEEMWIKYFGLFDQRWDHSFDVTRWGDLGESFSFIQKRVLYLGLNMIGGTPYSWTEKSNRHRKHLEQVRALFEEHEGKFEVIVLLKHADPGRNHRDFFGDGDRDGLFIDMIRMLGKPTIHFHGDNHNYYEEEGEYGVDNYMRISLDGESVAPPIRVIIDVSKPNPVTVSRRQSNLRVKCCSDGWPRLDDDDYYHYDDDYYHYYYDDDE
mmetsp:Transcript_3038/g.6299  ORF Transcript_3038/g.6299 Transcript_3038/m.6299 type:complete len:812 (+) Transcript_3038:138-2573(+)